MATLKDLSEYTGYSIATISRILNHDPSMSASEETRRKVMEAAKTLNYAATKSRKGRNLKTALHLGVVLSCPYPQRRAAYEELWLSCVEQICKEMKIACAEIRLEQIGRFSAKDSGFDGILAIGLFQPAQINCLFHICEHVVFVDASPDEVHCDAVEANSAAGMTQAMEYLMAYGHEQIGYIGPCRVRGAHTRFPAEALYGLYLDAMREYGLEKECWVLNAPADARETAQVFGEYLQGNQPAPTALLAATEENALGAIAALENKGLSVPQDVSVLAFSDMGQQQPENPALTVVHLQPDAMCRAAIRLISERLPNHSPHGLRSVPKKVLIPPVLLQRQTVTDSRNPQLLEADSW